MPGKPRIGLALGSGSARGWAHIGILQALEATGIRPDVIAGTSVGAMVGAAYTMYGLDKLEARVRNLTPRDVLRLLDIKLANGGLIAGDRLVDLVHDDIRHTNLEDLRLPLAVVATDLGSGREIWLQRGPLDRAVRASMSLPGVFAPVEVDDLLLVDGGLVNPVPTSVCRALGADVVIAVNLNSDIVARKRQGLAKRWVGGDEAARNEFWEGLAAKLQESRAFTQLFKRNERTPNFLDILTTSVNIMQDRITRSRMAGDPPNIMLTPKLGHIRLLDYASAAEAIDAGRGCVENARESILEAVAGTSHVDRRRAP